MMVSRFTNCLCVVSILVLALVGVRFALPCIAQELEPRNWSHIPVDTNYLGAGYVYTEEDIFFDPTLRIEDTESDIDSFAIKYIRSFELLGKLARIEVLPIYQEARWKGLLEESPRTVHRSGFADPILRFAVNLVGSPPLAGDEYRQYRANTEHETIVGAGLAIQLPLGEYFDDKLLNLGGNRFVFRPQLGLVRDWGAWSVEVTTAAALFTENDDFFGNTRREQDPFYTIQTQLVYSFRPALWLAVGMGYGRGAESEIDGVTKDDERENLAWGVNFGFPLSQRVGAKIGYIGTNAEESVGADSANLQLALITYW